MVAGSLCPVWPALLPVGDNPITGTTVAAQPALAGAILEDTFTPYDFSGAGGHLTGQVESRVVRSSLTGTLDFYWRVIPDATSIGDIYAFRIGIFAGVLDANWRSDDSGNVAPQIARHFGGGYVNYLFSEVGPGVGPSDSSRFFFLSTDTTAYARVGIYDLLSTPGDAVSPLFRTFAPVPTLSVTPSDNSSIQVAWTTTFPDYSLEATASLAVPNWEPVMHSIAIESDRFIVRLPTIGVQRFFRLRRP